MLDYIFSNYIIICITIYEHNGDASPEKCQFCVTGSNGRKVLAQVVTAVLWNVGSYLPVVRVQQPYRYEFSSLLFVVYIKIINFLSSPLF